VEAGEHCLRTGVGSKSVVGCAFGGRDERPQDPGIPSPIK
jgi:hypothetical protein